jgi:hypothetical protein
MSIEISFAMKEGYLLVSARGQFERVAARAALTEVRAHAIKAGAMRILIDAQGLSAPATEFDRHLVGLAISELFPREYRVAALYKDEWINKFAENTAVNRGAHFLVTSKADEAIRWLLEES